MKEVVKNVHDVLERRWKKAGCPVHGTEPCLWDMERFIDGLNQQRETEAVLAEGVELLEAWIECGEPATADELAVIHSAKDILAAVPA